MVHGQKVLDSCGNCLLPSDKGFNSCPEIIDVDITVVPGNKSTRLVLTVAGMKERVNCFLEGNNARYVMLTVKSQNNASLF